MKTERIEPEAEDAAIRAQLPNATVADWVIIYNAIKAAPDGIFLKERVLARRIQDLIIINRNSINA